MPGTPPKLVAICLPLFMLAAATTRAQQYTPQPLARIAPGAVISERPPMGWSHVALVVSPRLGSGDVDAVPNTAAYYAGMFKFVVAANVVREEAEGKVRFNLAHLANGFAMKINDKNVVVSAETQSELGGGLSFIGEAVLSGNERCLKDIRQVAWSSGIRVFDAKAIVHFENENREMVLRHFLYVNQRDGSLSMIVWLLKPDGAGGYQLVNDEMQRLPAGFHEDRLIHVDKSKFSFGIPTEAAFALVRVPQGKPLPVTPELRTACAVRNFNVENFSTLIREISASLSR